MKIVKYETVSEHKQKIFDNMVNDYIEKGFVPYGNAYSIKFCDRYYHTQAMVKYSADNEDEDIKCKPMSEDQVNELLSGIKPGSLVFNRFPDPDPNKLFFDQVTSEKYVLTPYVESAPNKLTFGSIEISEFNGDKYWIRSIHNDNEGMEIFAAQLEDILCIWLSDNFKQGEDEHG